MDAQVHTIYLRNLNEKVSLTKLKTAVHDICTPFGKVVLVIAHKNLRMKGQAFVAFPSQLIAQEAIRGLHHLSLLGKTIDVTFARSDSDQYFIDVKSDTGPIAERKDRKRLREASLESAEPTVSKAKTGSKEAKSRPSKLTADPKRSTNDWKNMRPNNVLLLLNISIPTDQDSLVGKFEVHAGLESVRFIKARNLALITFDEPMSARMCLETLTPEDLVNEYGQEAILTYAKK